MPATRSDIAEQLGEIRSELVEIRNSQRAMFARLNLLTELLASKTDLAHAHVERRTPNHTNEETTYDRYDRTC
jgi:hypothetical protein